MKARLLKETWYLPSLAIGEEDFFGNGLFIAPYLAASKQFGPIDVTAGYVRKRINGAFAGVRYHPEFLKNWSLVDEHDATNYPNDRFASQSSAINRHKGMAYGVEYHYGWLGARLAWKKNATPFAYVSIPLNRKEFIPQFAEPAPYT